MHSNETDDDDGGWDRESPGERPEYDFDHDRGCPKCDTQEVYVGQFRSGGQTATIVDAPGKPFRMVVCRACGYSELYRFGDDDAELVDTFLE